ncbi:MAG: 2-C-methyl-D-erythritol 2,4-cyclodiphosphate synthase [Clostridia bacterium]|nr:2-C-methyl-D-erythritol 2,4-cyclodiphosphate synthase [Clostridia bacterium]
MTPSVGVIICAAGKGSRAGFSKNKLLTSLNGSTVLEKTLSAFDMETIEEILITASEEDFPIIEQLAQKYPRTTVVLGGETRFHSVHGALQVVKSDIVLIHDGARPFVSRAVIDNCIQSVKQHGSGICSVPCTDTMAVTSSTGEIARIPNRNLLVRLQTPQGFYTQEIKLAYQRAIEQGKQYQVSFTNANGEKENSVITTRTAKEYTDDSSVYYDFIRFPFLCEGAEENIKLTYPKDFQSSPTRVGFGIDTHAFGKEQAYILLAGVKIPSKSGLIAHSDGDVLVHAVMDALLSAAGLRDIGFYFPDTDERYRNANSMELLQRIHGMLVEQNYHILNLSIAILAEHPKLSPYIEKMKEALAESLEITPAQIGITAGTNEGLGYIGEGKGITVHAYALLNKD